MRSAGASVAALAAAAALIAASPAAAAPPVDWPTYGYSASRAGLNPHEATLRKGNVGRLAQRWSVDLGGQVDAQPVLAAGVVLSPARTADLVYVGTEMGRFVAVDAATGEVVWSRQLGSVRVTECNWDFGITDTAVLDRAGGSVYVVSGTGIAYELDLRTGTTRRQWTITTDPQHEHVWSGLNLVNGILYIPTAGNCDFPPFDGRVVAIDTATGKRKATWYVTGRDGPGGGGIWGWGGVSAAGGSIWAATGNSLTKSEHHPHAERIVRLTPGLKVRISHYPGLPGGDADFGSTPLPYRAKGCPGQLAAGNKYGDFFVYDRKHIGKGPVQRIRLGGAGNGDAALLGVAAFWPKQRLLYVANPHRSGRYKPGLLAFRVTKRCRLSLEWQAKRPGNLTSSPTVANGVVYYGEGHGNKLVAFDARNGKRLWTSGGVFGDAVWNAPSVVNGAVYAGSWDEHLHAFGLK
jgi:outer membrane protein assembly factor BamB